MGHVGRFARRWSACTALGIAFVLLIVSAPSGQPRKQESGGTNQAAQPYQAAPKPAATLGDVVAAYEQGRREAQIHRPLYEQPDFWIAAFTLLLFISTALLWYATEKTIKNSRSASAQELRAYLNVTGAHVSNIGIGNIADSLVVIKNLGKTPAYKVISRYGLMVGDFPPPDGGVSYPADLRVAPSPLGPGAATHLGIPTEGRLSPEQIDGLIDGSLAIWIFGHVTYEDAFGGTHFTDYRQFIGGNIGLPDDGTTAVWFDGNDCD